MANCARWNASSDAASCGRRRRGSTIRPQPRHSILRTGNADFPVDKINNVRSDPHNRNVRRDTAARRARSRVAGHTPATARSTEATRGRNHSR